VQCADARAFPWPDRELADVLGRRAHLRAREEALAAESAPAKFAGEPAVGLDYVAGTSGPDTLARLLEVMTAVARDAETYFDGGRPAFRRAGPMLSFDSPLGGDGPNGIARAQIYDSGRRARAVVLLPYWNAAREAARPFGRLLAACGVTCVQLSLPYHDERQTPGTGFARELACENLGLTIRSNRQAVIDARACIDWLEQEGYRRIGIVGVSIGASIGSIVAAIDARVRAAALLLMADDFADVIWTGSATRHVRASLERAFNQDEVRAAWSIISPATHAARLTARLDRLLIVSGELDTVFLPELTRRYIARLEALGLRPTWLRYGCGHYTLGLPTYAARCFLRTLGYLHATL
jgi:hypothetical protein